MTIELASCLTSYASSYTADRAAALSGVPKSTVYYWARHRIIVPSVSAEPTRLWSFTDLMALRTVSWLRKEKPSGSDRVIRATPMKEVKRALTQLRDLDLHLFEARRPNIHVTPDGKIVMTTDGAMPRTLDGQTVMLDVLDLIAPFSEDGIVRGPDLVTPRAHLRIVPLKLSGAPHIEGTRIETEALFALHRRGLATDKIHQLYPAVSLESVREAISLETQLAENVSAAAA